MSGSNYKRAWECNPRIPLEGKDNYMCTNVRCLYLMLQNFKNPCGTYNIVCPVILPCCLTYKICITKYVAFYILLNIT